jgi:phosphodiesterase/alkaline phosphatase D-like protein
LWGRVRRGERVHRCLSSTGGPGRGPGARPAVVDSPAANGTNLQTKPGPETAYLGATQIEWLTRKLAESRATWPFWEFVAGPANAGTFGPNALDDTFGPEVVFQKVPPAGQSNLAPTAGLQFFGQIDIDPRSKDLVVQLKDLNGNSVFTQRLEARPCAGWHD